MSGDQGASPVGDRAAGPSDLSRASASSQSSTPSALLLALEPFLRAAAVGSAVEDMTRTAELRKNGLTPLIGFAGYAGQHAAESNVSWAAWKQLLDVLDDTGIASAIDAAAAGETRSGSTEGESAVPQADAQPSTTESQP